MPWREVRDTLDLVRRLRVAQFPQWADLLVTPVDGNGWDNKTFRLGGHLSVRLPSGDPWRAAHGGPVSPRGSPMGRRMQPRNEKFLTLFRNACSNVVMGAAMLMDSVSAPRALGGARQTHARHRARPTTPPEGARFRSEIEARRPRAAGLTTRRDLVAVAGQLLLASYWQSRWSPARL